MGLDQAGWGIGSEMPRGAHGLVGQTVGFVVADDMFGDGIELELAPHPNGDIGQMIQADGAMGRFGVAAGRFARLDRLGDTAHERQAEAERSSVVVPGAAGAVAVVAAHGHRIAALTGPDPAVGLLLFDLRTCLTDAYPPEDAR